MLSQLEFPALCGSEPCHPALILTRVRLRLLVSKHTRETGVQVCGDRFDVRLIRTSYTVLHMDDRDALSCTAKKHILVYTRNFSFVSDVLPREIKFSLKQRIHSNVEYRGQRSTLGRICCYTQAEEIHTI